MGRFNQLAGLTESNDTDPMLGVRLRDLGAEANTLMTQIKQVAAGARPIVSQLEKVIGEMNGIAKRL